MSDSPLTMAIHIRVLSNLDTRPDTLFIILNAYRSGNIFILEDIAGSPVGYVAYGKVSKQTLWMLKIGHPQPRYPYEWNEGHITLLMDVVFVPHRKADARKSFLKFVRNNRAISYKRNNKLTVAIRNGRIFRQISF